MSGSTESYKLLKAAIYARVSTVDKGQDPEVQLSPLRDFCHARGFEIQGEYVDYISGSKSSRPQLDHLLSLARRRLIDVIVVWKLDRFSRSLKHLVTVLDELNSLGVGFISYSENIDLTTPTGRLMMHLIGAMAEFERELIRERVKAGIEHSRRNGSIADLPFVLQVRVVDCPISILSGVAVKVISTGPVPLSSVPPPPQPDIAIDITMAIIAHTHLKDMIFVFMITSLRRFIDEIIT